MGWRRCNTLGLYTQTNLGTIWVTTLSLTGWSTLFSEGSAPDFLTATPTLGSAAALLGVVNAVIGSNTLLHYGPALTIDRGPKFSSTLDATGPASDPAKLCAGLYSLAAVADVVLPALLQPLKEAMGSAVGAAELMGAVSAGLTAALLGLWARFEIGYSTSQAVTKAANSAADSDLIMQTNRAFKLLTRRIGQSTAYAQDAIDFINAVSVAEAGHGPGESAPSHYQDCAARYTIDAPVINLRSDPGVEWTGPSAIYIQALGGEEEGGDVLVFGSDCVFVAAGSMGSINVETNAEEQGLITADCGPAGTITLQSGEAQEPNALVLGPEGISASSLELIKLQTVENSVTIDPEEGITLQVGENTITLTPEGIVLSCGPSSIEITAAGIVIDGPTVTINGEGETTISTPALAITE
jgi:hypothetical protein